MEAPNIKKPNNELLQEIISMVKACKTDIKDIREDIHYIKNTIKINNALNKDKKPEPIQKGWFGF